jgi:hypothetical protein
MCGLVEGGLVGDLVGGFDCNKILIEYIHLGVLRN